MLRFTTIRLVSIILSCPSQEKEFAVGHFNTIHRILSFFQNTFLHPASIFIFARGVSHFQITSHSISSATHD